MTVRCFVGEAQVAGIPAHDRGFAYGDGLFETMRAHRGWLPWWDAHWARLSRGAARLRITLPDESLAMAQAKHLLDGDDGVLKLVVSRGQGRDGGGRGYAPAHDSRPTWVLSRHVLPAPSPVGGLTLRWCDTRLALQPALAGFKHCNRLEQVLARAEWDAAACTGPTAHEGLMRSMAGDVVSATAANVFVLKDSRWATPKVDRCGVDGTCRQWVLGVLDVEERRVPPANIESADAVFLCNAVRGILSVARLGARCWPRHDRVIELQRRLAEIHPGFAPVPPLPIPHLEMP